MTKVFRFFALAFVATPFWGQVTTGSLSGTVIDASGSAVPAATVTLTSSTTNEVHTTKTNGTGDYSFVALQPTVYTLRVEQQGFKAAERTNINVLADDRVSVGDIRLEVGTQTETVLVEGQGTQVSTDSSQLTGTVTTKQLANLTARGREVVSLLRTIPGVSYQADQDSAGGTYGTGTPSIAGASANANHIAVDGVTSNDQGSPNVFSSVTTLDAIGEVRVLLNGYQAEYTGNGGPVVQVISKSGTREFHGSGYEYLRNEDLNANSFFNNRNGVARPSYRYNTPGATLGGPIYIPHVWNHSRDKLFGFYNIDIQRIKTPGALTSYTVPSALERMGNFSQSLDLSGAVIPVTDSRNGGAPFPGNIIPASRLDPNGLALLKILPLPNFLNRAVSLGNYNYQTQEILQTPKRSQLFKIDYVPTSKDRFYVRGKTFLSEQKGYAVSSGATPVGLFGQCYCFTESGLAIVGTHIFSPSVILEYNTGVRHNHEAWHPYGENGATDQQELDKVSRSKIGFNLGQWFPSGLSHI